MELSMRDRDRISGLRQVGEGVLSAADGAVRFGVTERHFRRVRRRFEAEGDGVVVDRAGTSVGASARKASRLGRSSAPRRRSWASR